MKIRQAIQRLGWRFSEASKTASKSFTINQTDVDAITEISNFYESQIKINESNNKLLVKMYIWHRIEMMKHHKEDIFGVQAQRSLAKALCNPVDMYYKRFTEYLNQEEYLAFIEQETANPKNWILMKDPEKDKVISNIQDKIKDNPDLFKVLSGEAWDVEDVKENLIAEINQLMLIAN